jgi:hypothetical protein
MAWDLEKAWKELDDLAKSTFGLTVGSRNACGEADETNSLGFIPAA